MSRYGRRVRCPRRRIARAGVTRMEVATVAAIGLVACVLALPLVVEYREAAREAQCVQNLKTIGISMHTFATMDPEERFLSGPMNPLTEGCPDLYGWPADMAAMAAGRAHELRCPANPIGATEALSQLLTADFGRSTAPVDRRGKGFCNALPVVGTPPDPLVLRERASKVAAKIRELGINTNYATSWHAAWSGVETTEVVQNGRTYNVTEPGPYLAGSSRRKGSLRRRFVDQSDQASNAIAVLGDSANANRLRAAPLAFDVKLGDARLQAGQPVGAVMGEGPIQVDSKRGELVPFIEATKIENICFNKNPKVGRVLDDRTAATLMPGTGTPGSHPTPVLLDTRHWAAVHRHRLNLLMADGSVRTVVDLNRDGYVNPGFHCPASCPPTWFESQTGYKDGLVEIDATEVFMGVALIEFRSHVGCCFGDCE
jgi:prepilin-type processing-associated H-X9-DG protein